MNIIGTDNAITTNIVADNTTNLYSNTDVKSAFDNAKFKSNTPNVDTTNYNIMGMIARAGTASNYIFKKDIKYTLHYTLTGNWENAVTATPNGAYLNLSLWTTTRHENLTNQNIISTSSGTPINKTYEFTPEQDCYAQFNFLLRRVKAGGYMTVSASTTYNRRFVDDTIDCLVASQDVAFTTTTEKRYVSSYRIIGTPYNGLVFDNDGKIKYHDHNLSYKDTGKTYIAGTWYNVMVRYNFKEKKVIYYLDGVQIAEDEMPQANSDARYQFGEISLKVGSNKDQPGIVYLDNLKLYKEEDADKTNYLTSEITSMYKSSFLTVEEIEFRGRVNDGKSGFAAPETKIYVDETLLDTVTKNTYSVKKNDLSAGEHTFKAVSTTKDNRTITKEKKVFVADFYMPTTYGDGMVLQRNKPIKIAGFGNDGTKVTVTLNNISKETTVSNGKFEVIFEAQSEVKSTTLSISAGGVTKTYNNVAIGEVILCNGQSNMAYPLARFTELHDLWDKDYDNIRFFEQDEIQVPEVQTDILSGRWINATKMDALYFSGFAYGTARKLHDYIGQDVVIGLVKAAIGGTSINTWVPKGAFDNDPDLYSRRNTGRTAYNAMVAPLTDYTIGSVMWYQGEADSYANLNYEKMLTKYIDSMREAWNDEDLPFAIVLIPIFNYQQQYGNNRQITGVREAEWNVSQRLNNVETIVGIDTGDYSDIHPNDKSILCERMATVIRHFINPGDSSIQYKSPSMDNWKYKDGNIVISFKDIYGGLKTRDDAAPRGFKISADGKEFTDVAAQLDDNQIVINTAGYGDNPIVRYAWEDAPAREKNTTQLNLVNSAGLPVPPFRTDNLKYRYNTSGVAANFVPMVRNISTNPMVNNSAYIIVNARDYDGEIDTVEVFVDGTSIGYADKKSECEYAVLWNNAATGNHKVHAIVTDTDGGVSTTQDSNLGKIIVNPYNYNNNVKQGAAVTFAETHKTFDQHDDPSVTAYLYTATIENNADGISINIGAKNDNTTKYIDTAISGNGSIQFGVLTNTESTVTGTAKQNID